MIYSSDLKTDVRVKLVFSFQQKTPYDDSRLKNF